MDPDQLSQLLQTMNQMVLNQQVILDQMRSSSTQAPVPTLSNFEPFNSSKEPFKQYMERFGNYVQMKQISADKETCKQLLLNSIGPEGYKAFRTVAAPSDPSILTYDDLISKTMAYLHPKVNIIVEQHRFFNCSQTAQQSISHFVASLKERISVCEFTCSCSCKCKCDQQITSLLLRTQFIRGLHDSTTREQILAIKDVTFDKAVEVALINEASRINNKELTTAASSTTYGKPPDDNHVYRISSKKTNSSAKHPEYQSRSSKQHKQSKTKPKLDLRRLGIAHLCLRCGNSNHHTAECRTKPSSFKCQLCGLVGHVKKVCIKSLIRDEARSQNRTNFISPNSSSDESDVDPLDNFQIEEIVDIYGQSDMSDLKKYFIDVLIEGKPQRFEVDSGAGFTLIPTNDYHQLQLTSKLSPTSVKFRTYTSEIFKPIGVVEVPVSYKNHNSIERMYVVPSKYPAVMGRAWIRHLYVNLNDLDSDSSSIDRISPVLSVDDIQTLLRPFSNMFESKVGCIPNITCSLKLRENSKPVFIRERVIPYALRNQVDQELDNLEREGIITKVNLSDWGSPLVVVPKPDGKIRLCVDYKAGVNPQLVSGHYPIKRIEEILHSLRDSTHFCTLDLYKAYLHVKVDEESKAIQTISTQKGTYQVNRLSFGIKTAPSEFNRILDHILLGLEGSISYFDDIIVHGRSFDECKDRLIKCLERLQKFDLHLNESKCRFFKTEISYLGYIISHNKISKCPKKIAAIQSLCQPKDAKELRRFLGMVTYYSRFISNLSTITSPLRSLLTKNKKFLWSSECQAAFNKLKEEIASDRVLVPYDPLLPLTVACDASPTGVAGVLSHVIDGEERPISFVSRALTQAERNYSQLDREAVAIVFAVDKFFTYLHGRQFVLITDNKALTRILHQDAKLPAMTSARLLRYAIYLSGFNYKIQHREGNKHVNADFFSRNHGKLKGADMVIEREVRDLQDQTLNQISTLESITSDSIAKETSKDIELSSLKAHLLKGTIQNPDYSLQDGVIFRGNRVVVPTSLQSAVLQELHHTHAGVVKMKQLARRYCYWKAIDRDIEYLVKGCKPCALYRNSPGKVPLHHWEDPAENFDRIHIDYAGEFLGHHFLILVDAKSKWLEVKILKSAPTSESTISLLYEIFCYHGFPKVIVSDNATIFTSETFQQFCKENGIRQNLIAPGHPATNGLAERNVQTVKYKLARMSPSSTNLRKAVLEILFRYRATPLACGKSPAELYLGRKIRTRLDAMLPQRNTSKHRPIVPLHRHLRVGDRIQARWYHDNKPGWKFGKVLQKLGRLHYQVVLDNGFTLKRHIDQLRSCLVQPPQSTILSPNVTDPDQPLTSHNSDVKLDLTPFTPVPRPNEELPGPSSLPLERTGQQADENPGHQGRPSRNRRPPSYLSNYVWENYSVL